MEKRQAGNLLRPFLYADEAAESLESSATLCIATSIGEHEINSSTAYLIDSSELLGVGITLRFNSLENLTASALKMVNDIEDVSLVVLARDGARTPLRGSEVVWSSPLALLSQEVVLFTLGNRDDRGVVFGHPHGDKYIDIVMVRNHAAQLLSPLKPRMKGAILAKATFNIQRSTSFDPVKPFELTDQVRQEEGLSKDTWYFFRSEASFLTSLSFSGAFKLFIDKEILDATRVSVEKGFKLAVDYMITNQFRQSLVQEALTKINDVDDDELKDLLEQRGAVVMWLGEQLGNDWPEKLSKPDEATAEVLGNTGMRAKILRLEEEMTQ